MKIRGPATEATLTARLFDEHLEKGVIRRTSLAMAIVPRQQDLDNAKRFALEFMATPPPLTA